MFSNFTCLKSVDFKINWPFCKSHCKFVIIWWPESEKLLAMDIEPLYSRSSVTVTIRCRIESLKSTCLLLNYVLVWFVQY